MLKSAEKDFLQRPDSIARTTPNGRVTSIDKLSYQSNETTNCQIQISLNFINHITLPLGVKSVLSKIPLCRKLEFCWSLNSIHEHHISFKNIFLWLIFLSHHHRIDWSTWILNDVHCCRNRIHSCYYMRIFWFFTKHIRKYEEIIQKWCICFAIRNFFGKVHFVAVIIFGNTSLVKSCGFHSSLNCQIQTDFPGEKW